MTLCLNREDPNPFKYKSAITTSPARLATQPGPIPGLPIPLRTTQLTPTLRGSPRLLPRLGEEPSTRVCCSPRHTSHQTTSKKRQGLDRGRTLQGTKENQPPTRNPARPFLRPSSTTRGDIEQRVSATSRDSSAPPTWRLVPTLTSSVNDTVTVKQYVFPPTSHKNSIAATRNQVHAPENRPFSPRCCTQTPPSARSQSHRARVASSTLFLINVVKTERLNSIAQAYPLRGVPGAPCSCNGGNRRDPAETTTSWVAMWHCGESGLICFCSTARTIFDPA